MSDPEKSLTLKEKLFKAKEALRKCSNDKLEIALAKNAVLEIEVQIAKDRLSNIKSVRKYKGKQTRKMAIFRPMHTEGRLTFEALRDGKFRNVQITEEEEDKIAELVAMMTDPLLLAKYPSWDLRAIALGLTLARLSTLRQSHLYQRSLLEAIRMRAMEGVARATETQTMIADSDSKGSTMAFTKLGAIAGTDTQKETKVTKNVSISLEQKLRTDALKGAVDADFEVAEPPKKLKE